jgi:uncharacterized coiled-coil protein SlyX
MSNSEVKQEVSIEELQAQLAEKDSTISNIQGQLDAVKSKADELLDETKKAKALKREAEEIAKQEAEDKARKKGDYEQLLKSSETERNRLKDELNGIRTSMTKEKINNESLKIASELASGSNAEILSEFISRRLQITEEGLKVTDANGNLTIATVDHLKDEFRSNPKFKSLVDGIKSTGSGATPTSDGVTGQTPTREQIRAMGDIERSKYFQKLRESK